MTYQTVGQSVARLDGIEKVTGEAVFVDDISLPGMLHARVLRSQRAHALITGLDVSEAMAQPGVVAVVTGRGLPRRIGACIQDMYPMAVDRVRYVGEPVAVVVAENPHQAHHALASIKVSYQDLAVVTDPWEASRPGAPQIHPDQAVYHRLPGIHPLPGSNIFHRLQVCRGNTADAFREAFLVVENRYWHPSIYHVQLEPHGAIATYHQKGGLTMYASSQAPYVVRHVICELLGLPPGRVRVIVPYVGGGFGGKSDHTIEPLLAWVARHVPGRPVKLVLTREEMACGTVIGRGALVHYRSAVSQDGMLLGVEAEVFLNGGGYGDFAVNIVTAAGISATGPYQVPNIKITAHGVYTNTPPTGACRGYGHPEVHWACERQMDIIAARLGMSPVEIRLKNALGPGKVNAIGQQMESHNGRVDLCIQQVVDALGGPECFLPRTNPCVGSIALEPGGIEADPLPHPTGANASPKAEPSGACAKPAAMPGKVRGKGIAALMKCPIMPTNAQSGAIIKLEEDGGVMVSVGAIEMGQGCHTVLAQIAAEALSLPLERVQVAPQVDTFHSPYEWQTVASHTTWAVGNAIRLAAAQLCDKITRAAAVILQVPAERLEVVGGRVQDRERPERYLTLQQLARGYTDARGTALSAPLIGEGNFVPQGLSHLDPETGQGNIAADWTFACQGAEVEVDTRTGEVTVLRLVSAMDVGKVINPVLAEGQIYGAAVQAMGAAICEGIVFDREGRIRNPSLTDYKVPGVEDMPELQALFVETPEESGPYGARGLGEHGAVCVPPAIANAIQQATGLEFFDLPVTAEKIIRAQQKRGVPA